MLSLNVCELSLCLLLDELITHLISLSWD